ncbi:Hypothetical predicted protein, partial [Olea europaea subsp. europaea]
MGKQLSTVEICNSFRKPTQSGSCRPQLVQQAFGFGRTLKSHTVAASHCCPFKYYRCFMISGIREKIMGNLSKHMLLRILKKFLLLCVGIPDVLIRTE